MELVGLEVLKIRLLPGEFDYAKGTKMEGQKYRRYTTAGKVFITNDESFKECVENGGLFSATLDTNEEGQLSLTDFITWKQAKGQKSNQAEYDSITVENYKPIKTAQEVVDLAMA